MKLLLTILLFPCIVCLAKPIEEESHLHPVGEGCPEGFMLCQDPEEDHEECHLNEICQELGMETPGNGTKPEMAKDRTDTARCLCPPRRACRCL